MRNRPPARKDEKPGCPDDDRLCAARAWAAETLGQNTLDLIPVVQDASFRRYFRLKTGGKSLILMDAPPPSEDSGPFLDIASRLQQAGLHAPEILAFDLEQGFGLLEDLGNELYREVLTPASAATHFPELLQILARMAQQVNCDGLPEYDACRLQAELDLFTDWYLLRHKRHELSAHQKNVWQSLCAELRQSAAEQPKVFVHRDFHCSNLLFRNGRSPGIIDFQDAVRGPLSYDFVSLLWDRYVAWPRREIEGWMEEFRLLVAPDAEPVEWMRWCDLMGLQRNIKIVGIFARLHHRDGKSGYLRMIPRFYRYLLDVLPLYPDFREFLEMLEEPECAP